MDFTRINRSELVYGNTKRKTAVAEALIRSNTLNITGTTNYNAGGVKDNVGFVNVTEKFVDNFILRVLVPDYNTKNGKNIFIGSQNKSIRELLNAHGLTKCNVKAIVFTQLNDAPPPLTLEKMPFRDMEKMVNTYYYQEYKIACPNVEYSIVMNFIRSLSYNAIGMFLKDIDITLDYAGSFDKDEVIEHLISNEDFRQEGTFGEADRVIIDNDFMVGRNCLTYMESIGGFTTRQKIYNKMVQMLECRSVRTNVGSHWKDWVCQTGTRLADARDKARDRGLTRAEVTFYVESSIPSNECINRVLQSITRYVPKSLVYSTPYAATWNAYCNQFLHSLVCIDRTTDVGIIVYSYNERTRNISGQVVERWSEREKWCLENLTLNGNLPLDIIESIEVSKTFSGKRKDSVLEISGSRYFKIHPDSSTRFQTRLVSKGGVYSYNCNTLENNASLLEKVGFMEHANCVPYLAKSKASDNHKADVKLRKVEVLDVRLSSRKQDKKRVEVELKERLSEKAKDIEEIRKPLFIELQHKEEEIKRIKTYKYYFKGCGTVPLRDLSQGSYTVRTAKKLKTRFGSSYKLLVEDGDNTYTVWSNECIANTFEKIVNDNVVHLYGDFLSLEGQPLGVLTITGKGTNQYGKIFVYCMFTLNRINKAEESLPIVNSTVDSTSTTEILTITRENLLPYRDYKNLAVLPVGSIHKVEAIGNVTHYGTPRLVVKIEDTIYQAGQDLEEKVDQLTPACSIKIDKIRTSQTRHVKYVVCSIYEKDDWTAMVDYVKTSMLSKFDGSTCIVDVRIVDVRGTKRKLLLTNSGDVYKLKKSKLEETIKPGFV